MSGKNRYPRIFVRNPNIRNTEFDSDHIHHTEILDEYRFMVWHHKDNGLVHDSVLYKERNIHEFLTSYGFMEIKKPGSFTSILNTWKDKNEFGNNY